MGVESVPYTPPPVKLGSTGDKVFAIKRALVKSGDLSRVGGLKRFMGERAVGAVKRFQKAHGLTADGQVGAKTLAELDAFFDEYGYYLYTGRFPGVPPVEILRQFTKTHDTAGLPNFPAIDLFAPPGTIVVAQEDVVLEWPHFISWDQRKHVGGWTCYLQVGRKRTYYVTHFAQVQPRGLYAAGEKLGTVGEVPHNWWPSHIHEGLHQGHYELPQV